MESSCHTNFSENILEILNVFVKKILPQSKRTKKTSKKIFKKDEEEEYGRRKPAVKTKDKSQG